MKNLNDIVNFKIREISDFVNLKMKTISNLVNFKGEKSKENTQNLFTGNRSKIGIALLSCLLVSVLVISSFAVIAVTEDQEITIDTLINDTMLEVKDLNWADYTTAARTPLNPEWNKLLASNKPLNVYEVYEEDFSKSFFESRLRPYTATYNTPDVPPDASYRIVESGGKKSVLMETNGVTGGVFDFIEFSGMKFIDGATYSVSVDFTVVTPNRLFKMGFGPNAASPYFLDLSGTAAGQKSTATGKFSTSGLGPDIHSALILMVAGGDAPASIQIDKIKITRLPSKPKANNAVISGNTAVGATLTLSYDYYQDTNIAEGNSDIVWFTATDTLGKNMTLIYTTTGKKSITVTSDMSGLFVGAYITLKTITPNDNGIGDNQFAITKRTIGSSQYYGPYALDEVGKSITEDFESILTSGNISYTPDPFVTSYITDKAGVAISGKSLYIDSPGGIKGGIFNDVTFAPDKSYVLSFKYKFIGQAPSNFNVQMRSVSSGYSADIYQQILSPVTDTVKTFTSKQFKIGSIDDYYVQMFDAYGPYKVVIDDLKFECVEPIVIIPPPPETPSDSSTLDDLATVGKIYTNNFTKEGLNLFTYRTDYNYIIEDGESIAGKSYKFDVTKDVFAGVYALGTKGKLVAGGKYRLKVDYKFTSLNAPPNLYFGFTNDPALQENKAANLSGKLSNTLYTFQGDYTLANVNSNYLQMFVYNPQVSSIVIIDNISLERLP
jgi:hypothetical protein